MMRSPTLRSANYLLLTTLLALGLLGSLLMRRLGDWGSAVAELAATLIPLAITLYRRRLPLAETLALRWPSFRTVALAGLTGLGTISLAHLVSYVLIPWVNGDLTRTLGLSTSLPSVAAVTLLVVAAPLAEEPLYRGYVFKAYALRSPKIAMVITALLFLFWHLRLIGLITLMPLAFALSYVRWRSDSLYTGMAMHALHNGATFLFPLVLRGLGPMVTRTAEIGVLSAFGVIGALAFWLFIRTTSAPAPASVPAETEVLPPILAAETVARIDAILGAEAAGADQQLPGQNKLPLKVTRGSHLTLGDKEYDTWTVMLGKNERAIYDAASNHTLLRYDNGVDTYLLTAAN